MRVKKIITVKVPAGVNNGSTLRVRGEGDAGTRGGPAGDLYVFLNLKEVPGIQRDGINLYSSLSISYSDAILGSTIPVKTVDGILDLPIPPGTQPGDVLVFLKRGVPRLDRPSVRGDHRFTVKVTIPTRLSDAERERVEELASLYRAKSGRTSYTKIRSRPQRAKNESEQKNSMKIDADDGAGGENSQSEGLWGSIKNFAGSAATGILKWLRDTF